MIDNYPEVETAHKSDDLLFGTVESWVAYVRVLLPTMSFMFLATKPFRICLGAFRKVSISAKSQMHLALCYSTLLR